MTEKNLKSHDPSPMKVQIAQTLFELPPEEIAGLLLLGKEIMLKRAKRSAEGKEDRRDRFRYHAKSLEVLAMALYKTAEMSRA
jgi:hypothetical protein